MLARCVFEKEKKNCLSTDWYAPPERANLRPSARSFRSRINGNNSLPLPLLLLFNTTLYAEVDRARVFLSVYRGRTRISVPLPKRASGMHALSKAWSVFQRHSFPYTSSSVLQLPVVHSFIIEE
jgi:hypothetical protein